MTEYLPVKLVRLVRLRAGNACEYCLLPQDWQEASFHIDHFRPRAAGGAATADNLALACVTCSLRKAARTKVRDPRTKEFVALFHPRADCWTDHFGRVRGARLVGRTPKGRATILALGMNRPAVIAIRRALVKLGRLP